MGIRIWSSVMNLREYRVVNTSFSIKHSESGHLIEEDSGIKQEGVHLFTNLFAPPQLLLLITIWLMILLAAFLLLLRKLITRCCLPLLHQKKLKMWYSSSVFDKDPGPNGFTTLFNKKCWDFINTNLLVVVEEWRRNAKIIRCFNSANIAIVPKAK